MKKICTVKKHMIKPYVRKYVGTVDNIFERIDKDKDFKENYYSFTSLLYDKKREILFCGNTNFNNNLLHTFNLKTKQFESLGYPKFGEEFEIKIHRGLELASDGMIYGATSSLHYENKRLDAPGGKVFKYDFENKSYTTIAIPSPHDYIQTISLDEERAMIYGFTYPVFNFFAYSLIEKKVVYNQFMNSISHISAIDDNGGFWGTWGSKHHLFRYDPVKNKVKFYNHGFPEKGGNLMYRNAGPVDCMINGADGFLYVATDLGSLYKLTPETGEVEFLGKPFPGIRMPGMIMDDNGLIYLSGGDDNNCQLAVYDRKSKKFTNLGNIICSEDGERCFRTHDLELVGNTVYVGETDNPIRTDYLWECIIEDN